MIPDEGGLDRGEVFSQILLLGELFTPQGLEGEKKCLWDILRKYGITLNRSDCVILDHSRIGNSTITIAKYTLEYTRDRDPRRKRIFLEGSVTMQTDEIGNTHIRISSRPSPFRLDIDSVHSEESLISSKI